jgi:hypothetical protein
MLLLVEYRPCFYMAKRQQAPTLVRFRNYFEQLEVHLGAVLVPIEPKATGPRQIVTSEALHADLARRAAVEVYRENQCRGMQSPVRLFPTLDALGRIRFKAEDSDTTDQASIEFLESLGKATLLILGAQPTSDFNSGPNSS